MEDADVETSSEAYARRFAGAVGGWFLDVQAEATLDLLRAVPARARRSTSAAGTGSSRVPWSAAGLRGHGGGQPRGLPGAGPAASSTAARCAFQAADLLRLPFAAARVRRRAGLSPAAPRRAAGASWWPSCAGWRRRAVIVDYPTRRSINAMAAPLFGLKKRRGGRHAAVRRLRATPTSRRRSPRPDSGRRPRAPAVRGPHGRSIARSAWRRCRARLEGARARRRASRRRLGSPVIVRAERVWLMPRALGPRALPALRPQAAQAAPRSRPCSARPTGLRCLDLGSDNGVVSLLLRRRGGRWASADLTAEAVASIRELVETDVHLVTAARLPFADARVRPRGGGGHAGARPRRRAPSPPSWRA